MCKAFGRTSELLKGLAGRLHLPDASSGCPKRSEGGSPATARRKCVGASLTKQARRSQQKTEKATAALPLQFVMSVSRTQALHILSRGAKCLTYEAEGRCPPS